MSKREKRRQKLRDIEDKLVEHQLPDELKEAVEHLPDEEDARQWLVEHRIQQAMIEGAFDNLPGKGKPLDFKENPYLDPTLGLAFDLLQNNRSAPEWIERDKEIRRGRDAARRELGLAWQAYQADPSQVAAWQAAVARFDSNLHRLNRKIDDFNLIVPILSCQRARLRLADELRRIQEEDPA